MKKFGFGSKSEADDDSMRSGLFGRKKSSPAQDANPYAQEPADDPYANGKMMPQISGRAGLPSGGPRGGRPGLPSAPGRANSGGPPPPYTTHQPNAGYSNEKVGNYNAYGANRYDVNAAAYNTNQSSTQVISSRVGGYGGMGDDGSTRDNLFGNAPSRRPPPRSTIPDANGDYDSGNKYDGYGEHRELTEEEREKQELRGMKDEWNREVDATEDTLDRILQAVDGIDQTAGSIGYRLASQRERLINTDQNLNRAAAHNRVAEDRTKELKKLNRSMFVPVAGNPFTRKSREQAEISAKLGQHQLEKSAREETRREGYQSQLKMDARFGAIDHDMDRLSSTKREIDTKFMFEEDDSDDPDGSLAAMARERELRIDGKMAGLENASKRIHKYVVAIGETLDEDLDYVDGIAAKSDAVDNQVKLNREKLGRIR